MDIRKAEISDIPEIIFWGEKFFDYSPWNGRADFNKEHLAQSLEGIISGDGAVFLNGHGICGGVIFPMYFNHDIRCAVELFWYAERGGRSLRRSFEAWAKDAGATAFQMTCLADEQEGRMRSHYSKLGYAPMETSFYKEVI